MEIFGQSKKFYGAGRLVRWGARRGGFVGRSFARYDSYRNRRIFKRNRTMGF